MLKFTSKPSTLIILTLFNLAILFTNASLPAIAQGIGSYFLAMSVASVGTCPTPSFTNNQLGGVLCSDTQDLYFMSPAHPAPVKINITAPVLPANVVTYTGTLTAGHLATWSSTGVITDGGAVPAAPPSPTGINCSAFTVDISGLKAGTGINSTTSPCTIK